MRAWWSVGPDATGVRAKRPGGGVGGPVPLGFVLTAAMGVASFPIFALAALGPLVVAELDISRTRFGAVSTTMFATAIVGSLLIGRAVDRVGARRVMVALFLASSTAVGLVASAGSFSRLLVAGLVVGVAQASANPATNSVVSHHVRIEHRGTLMGVKQAGVPLSQFLAGGVLAPLAVIIGWRAAVLLGLLLILPALLATLAVLPGGTPASTPEVRVPRMGVPGGLGWLFACTFLLATALQSVNVYLPLYAFEVVGMSASAAGVLVGVVGAVGMVARILLGRVAGASTRPVRIVAMIGVVATFAAMSITASAAGSHLLLWLGAITFGASVFGFNVVGMTLIIRSVDAASAGRASGGLSTVMFTGFALGPIGFGSLVDVTGSYTIAWALVACVCGLAGAVGLTAWSRMGRRVAS